MTYYADLTGTGRVRHIGYLARGHYYTKGTTSETFFDHLVALVERPLGAWAGYHTCNLGWCGLRLHPPQPTLRYKGRVLGLGDTDIFVPGDEVVYWASSLIPPLHSTPQIRATLSLCQCCAQLPGSSFTGILRCNQENCARDGLFPWASDRPRIVAESPCHSQTVRC
jgi:hypothetical protein